MSDSLAAILARRPKSTAAQFADLLRDAAAAARQGDDASAASAVGQLPLEPLNAYILPHFDAAAKTAAPVIARGQAASPGAAVGRPAFSAAEAIARTARRESVLLVKLETDAGDMEAIHRCAGVLTTTGGMTSHAAVVARGWGRPCVSGAADIRIDARRKTLRIGHHTFTTRDALAIDGGTGEVLAGELPVLGPQLSDDLLAVLAWCDKHATLKVFANADAPADAALARQLGAQGIGLCRTEHMFFEPRRLLALRRMILADSDKARTAALRKLLPFQRRDFTMILEAMAGLPVTVRLLDPPLHEFVPEDRASQRELAAALKVPLKQVQARVAQLREANPMLGHRGCRLCITFPQILHMQVTALVEATIDCLDRGIDTRPRILHPIVGGEGELRLLRQMTLDTIAAAAANAGRSEPLDIPIGTMIEVPRAALTADALARHADFFSFGTNDLTQLTFGYSRDDSASFLPLYLDNGVLPADPFQSLDIDGVGQLMELAVTRGRGTKSNLHMSLCGEHGGDPDSIRLSHRLGLSAVSCSPFRVPIARLAAAKASLPQIARGAPSSIPQKPSDHPRR